MRSAAGTLMAVARRLLAVFSAFGLLGCASMQEIHNVQPVKEGYGYQTTYRSPEEVPARLVVSKSVSCEDASGIAAGRSATTVHNDVERLNPGDLLQVGVAEDETFTGTYEVSQDGTLRLPYVAAISARGRTVEAVERAVGDALVKAEFYEERPRVSVRIADFAPARVFVSGAVFDPNVVVVGSVAGNEIDRVRQTAIGGLATSRRLSQALRAAGGVRPDADLRNVKILRNGRTLTFDLRPAIFGRPFNDIILLDNDQIDVPSIACFQPLLARPSPITPQGIKVYMSNLSQPADANALAAVSKDTSELRYGARFMQAVFGMNCFGGAKLTNANRSAVLLTRDPVTGNSVVIERNIEKLLRRADRDSFDPYLMPYDAIACYDSTFISVSEVARILAVSSQPIILLSPN